MKRMRFGWRHMVGFGALIGAVLMNSSAMAQRTAAPDIDREITKLGPEYYETTIWAHGNSGRVETNDRPLFQDRPNTQVFSNGAVIKVQPQGWGLRVDVLEASDDSVEFWVHYAVPVPMGSKLLSFAASQNFAGWATTTIVHVWDGNTKIKEGALIIGQGLDGNIVTETISVSVLLSGTVSTGDFYEIFGVNVSAKVPKPAD